MRSNYVPDWTEYGPQYADNNMVECIGCGEWGPDRICRYCRAENLIDQKMEER